MFCGRTSASRTLDPYQEPRPGGLNHVVSPLLPPSIQYRTSGLPSSVKITLGCPRSFSTGSPCQRNFTSNPSVSGHSGYPLSALLSRVLDRVRVTVPFSQSTSSAPNSAMSFWYIPQFSISSRYNLFVLRNRRSPRATP